MICLALYRQRQHMLGNARLWRRPYQATQAFHVWSVIYELTLTKFLFLVGFSGP
jgi:hypothetical protein